MRPLSLSARFFDIRLVQVMYVNGQTSTGTCFSPSTCGFPVSLSFHRNASCISHQLIIVVKSITFLSVDCQWRVINSVAVCTVLAANSRSNVLNFNSEVKLIEVNERQK